MKTRVWIENRVTGSKCPMFAEAEIFAEFLKFGLQFAAHHELLSGFSVVVESDRFVVSETSTGVRFSGVFTDIAQAISDAKERLTYLRKSGIKKHLRSLLAVQAQQYQDEVVHQLTK